MYCVVKLKPIVYVDIDDSEYLSLIHVTRTDNTDASSLVCPKRTKNIITSRGMSFYDCATLMTVIIKSSFISLNAEKPHSNGG